LSLQKHTALPQRKITLIPKDMFVLNTAFVGGYGDVGYSGIYGGVLK